jgi:4-hydroxy-tetrahydrodipicolinate synthase
MSTEVQLRGIITAMVTPFSTTGSLDEESLRELVGFQLKHRVNGLFPLGTTGEGPAIEPQQRKRVAEIVVEETNHRVPVIVQVGASDPLISCELAAHAEEIGADIVACLTPFYYHPGEDAIVEHYQRLSKATALPIMVYNIPQNTGNNLNAKLLLKISKIPRIVGIKDSTGDFSQLLDYMRVVPEGFNIINGADSFQFSALCAGVNGGVSATANAFPEIFVEMYEAYKNRDLDRGRDLQLKVHALRAALNEPPIAPHLEALRMRGLRSGSVRPPLRQMTPTEIENLRLSIVRVLPELRLTA